MWGAGGWGLDDCSTVYSTYTVVEVFKYGIFDDISIWILNLEVEQIGALWCANKKYVMIDQHVKLPKFSHQG